ncbi:APC family permease [Alcanivorax sp. DP30]|uniref:APC family permease n=1 Tax=Alcanivorax sp. DP30 TaxID=2606217 RepID=UPI0019272331|nr:APC family permease [Alcanivorax sp. DP30]
MLGLPLKPSIHRKRNKPLGILELVAIALGGMVGGGIFSVLGISVALIGVYTPVAIALGGGVAAVAAYSYIKLALYYRDEGATYSFFKRTFPGSHFAASLIGWWVVFGYISTLALYAYTFASYAISSGAHGDNEWLRKGVAGMVILVFAVINIWSVKGMGKLEDLMVYAKLVILGLISFFLIRNGQVTLPELVDAQGPVSLMSILIVASLTFVAYEGFQLVIHAMNEMDTPERNIPIAIYTAVCAAIGIYVVIALGAILAIPFADIIRNKEYALATGAGDILGDIGARLVILGALLATSSAISGTLFGASRLMAVIANDGYFPRLLATRRKHIPVNAIIAMASLAFALVLIGGLELILEFGSMTFLLVSLLMAWANFRIRDKTDSSLTLTLLACAVLAGGTGMILYYELTHEIGQMLFVGGLYLVLMLGAWGYARTAR